MDKCLILFGLILNFIGVIFLFFGAKQYTKLPVGVSSNEHTTEVILAGEADNGDTVYPIYFRKGFLPTGLILVLLGIAFQFVGLLLS